MLFPLLVVVLYILEVGKVFRGIENFFRIGYTMGFLRYGGGYFLCVGLLPKVISVTIRLNWGYKTWCWSLIGRDKGAMLRKCTRMAEQSTQTKDNIEVM